MERKRYFENKDRITFPKILSDEIKLLSFSAEDSRLIGSAAYKIQKYPADLDLFEQVQVCCSREEAVEYFMYGIKNMVKNIKSKKFHWIIEVKCGIDDRYEVNEPLQDFLKDRINLFSLDDYNKLLDLSLENSVYAKEKIKEIIRKYLILRWTGDEIELGYMIRHRRKFYLENCIDTHLPINMEIIAVIDNKFTDMSNFFVLTFCDKLTGKEMSVNFPQAYIEDATNFTVYGLVQGINNVMFSEISRDVFKGIKRMYSIARLIKSDRLYEKIKPIISSDLSQLSQLKSELGTMNEILKFTDNIPWNVFYSQLDSIKWRIGGNLYISNDDIVYVVEKINEMLSNEKNIQYLIEETQSLKDFILLIVNREATFYLKSVGLYKKFNPASFISGDISKYEKTTVKK